MSRQREWQKKQREAGNCVLCGEPAVMGKKKLSHYCQDHLDKSRAWQRAYHNKIKLKPPTT